MKKIFTLSLLLATSGWAMAQFTVTPNPIVKTGSPYVLIECVGKFKNTSTSDNAFTWVRYQNLPSGWTSQVCDALTCWGDTVNSNTFTIAPGDSNILDLNVSPNGNYGSTTIKLFVYAVGKQSQGDTIYYTANTWAVGSGKVNISKELSFYPNPTQGELNIRYESKSPTHIDIYNIIGNKVKTFTHADNFSTVQVDDLPKGMYLLKVYDGAKTITKSFTKN